MNERERAYVKRLKDGLRLMALIAVVGVAAFAWLGYQVGWVDGRAALVDSYQDADLAKQNVQAQGVSTGTGGGIAASQGFIAWRTSEGRVVVEDYGD